MKKFLILILMLAPMSLLAQKFGYVNSAFMPAEAFDLMCVVDAVWLGQKDATTFLQEIDAAFQKDYDAGNCPVVPAQ